MIKQNLYYKSYEKRTPSILGAPSITRILLFRFFAIIYTVIAFEYVYWRITESINPDALIFSVSLLFAEIFMFIGSVLMIVNNWSTKEIRVTKPVRRLRELGVTDEKAERPLEIDIFIATYNESLALVEDTIKDAKKLKYPYEDVQINIFLCDDGQRDGRDSTKENFKNLAQKYNIQYLARENNVGFKAGNLNSAFWQTSGDLIVILDADTRVFPNFLENLTGYFRNEKMAWVQTPQWFYDISEGTTLKDNISSRFPAVGEYLSKLLPFSSKLRTGRDILGVDSTIFYNVVLFNRNASNAAFCCGAGSIHRRKALESLITNHGEDLKHLNSLVPVDKNRIKNQELLKRVQLPLGPFVHHISEDIYTSILLHSDKNKWESYQHPRVECRMLSPTSLPAYIKQFSRYAEGSFSIFFSRNNPLFKAGHTLKQRLAYGETLYSYFSPLWISILLFSPIYFYFTLTPPLKAFSFDFFLRLIMITSLVQIMMTIIHWGIPMNRSEQYFIASFWLKIVALIKVISGASLDFNTTTKDKEAGSFRSNLKFILPHLLILIFTLIGFGYNVYLLQFDLHPSYSAFIANTIWAGFNLYLLSPILIASLKTNQNE